MFSLKPICWKNRPYHTRPISVQKFIVKSHQSVENIKSCINAVAVAFAVRCAVEFAVPFADAFAIAFAVAFALGFVFAFLSVTEFTIPWRTIIRHYGCRLSVCQCVCLSRGKLRSWITFERFELEGWNVLWCLSKKNLRGANHIFFIWPTNHPTSYVTNPNKLTFPIMVRFGWNLVLK